ncbi:MAG TPA: hypothetical protein VHV50_14235 [Actinomycetota bacterium]|nr:hypothetical protein [Actinomycetota bacterium]
MRVKIGAFGALTVVLVAGFMLATLLPASSATSLKLYEKEREGFQTIINTDGKGNGPGDYFVGSHPLYRAGTSDRVGREIVQLTIIRTLGKNQRDARFRIASTFRVNGSTLEVAGSGKLSELEKGTAAFSITGGTRDYSGASGSATVRVGLRRDHITFNITP